MTTTLSVKRILSPYAAALWLAINFSYQNPGDPAVAQRRGNRVNHRRRAAEIDVHVAVVQHRVVEMVGDKAALRQVLFSSATTGNQRYPVSC